MALRVLFFGMEGIFSRAPLLELIRSGAEVCAVIVPRPEQSQRAAAPIWLVPPPRAPETDVPLLFEPADLNIIGIAWNAGIDVYESSHLGHIGAVETLTALNPQVLCVACFPRLVPKSLISHPSIFYPLNLHPSLLPDYRGPSPLFWIFHDGLEHAGVTVHLMDQDADTGDIVAQERVLLPDRVRYSDAEKILAERAGQLLVNALRAIERGALAHTPQPRIAAPRAPNPTERDYTITPEWTARRALNFIRGIAEWNQPITLKIGDRQFRVLDATTFDEIEKIETPFIQNGTKWRVQMAKGTLTCSLA